MSVGQEFDPSLLEGKDRSELATLAEALGEKPPARAKKADIVALILRLVGAEPPSEADGDAGERAAEAAEETDNAGSAEPAEDGAAASSDDDSAPAETDDAKGQSSDGSDNGGNRERGERNRGGAGGRDNNAESAAERDGEPEAGNRADPNGGGQGQQGGQGGDGEESGNRRRRRRGRDRDRRGEPGEEVPAEPVDVEGVVDLRDEGYGFLRVTSYLPSRNDAYISVKQVRQFGLRRGDVVKGRSRAANRNEKNPALLQVDEVNGHPAHTQPARPQFDELTPRFPDEPLRLERDGHPEDLTARLIDLLAPIGKGQRGLIVAPPKSGRTTILKQVVGALEANHPDLHVIVLLVDERPEEITEFERGLLRGELAASSFDRPAEEHVALADLVLARAKRLVESGQDVALVFDGLTRVTRAHDLGAPGGGRPVASGLDPSALLPAKRFFAAARKAEEGGSLTILATVVADTGSRADEVVVEELEGTANLELRLDRALADRRVFPSVDVDGTSTRHEELLYAENHLPQVQRLRRRLADLWEETGSAAAGLELVLTGLAEHATNAAFLADLAAQPED